MLRYLFIVIGNSCKTKPVAFPNFIFIKLRFFSCQIIFINQFTIEDLILPFIINLLAFKLKQFHPQKRFAESINQMSI